MPKRHWRLYEFKSDAKSSESGGHLRTLHMHRLSAFLIGTDQRVCDMHVLHPSISHQHAVWQYRCVTYTRADGFEGFHLCILLVGYEYHSIASSCCAQVAAYCLTSWISSRRTARS